MPRLVKVLIQYDSCFMTECNGLCSARAVVTSDHSWMGWQRRRGIWTSANGRETAKWKFWWEEAETNWILWLVLSFPSLRPRLGQLLEAGSLAQKKERGVMILLTEKRQNVLFSWLGLSLVGNEGIQIHHCSTAPCKETATNSKAQKVSENASEGPWDFFALPVTSLLSCLHA